MASVLFRFPVKAITVFFKAAVSVVMHGSMGVGEGEGMMVEVGGGDGSARAGVKLVCGMLRTVVELGLHPTTEAPITTRQDNVDTIVFITNRGLDPKGPLRETFRVWGGLTTWIDIVEMWYLICRRRLE